MENTTVSKSAQTDLELRPHKKYNYTMKPGRPSKTTADLPKNWKNIMLRMSRRGASEIQIRAAILSSNGLTYDSVRNTWYKLQEKDSEFREAIMLGKIFCEAWWIEKGQKKLNSKYFQGYTWFNNMKNRFGWHDKTEIEHGITDETFDKLKSLTPAEVDKKILEYTEINRIKNFLPNGSNP